MSDRENKQFVLITGASPGLKKLTKIHQVVSRWTNFLCEYNKL